jgi:hypothetical protein
MADVINLNQKRKAKARTDKEQRAAENRIKFGRTKEEKKLEAAKAEKQQRHIDGHKLEKDNE